MYKLNYKILKMYVRQLYKLVYV